METERGLDAVKRNKELVRRLRAAGDAQDEATIDEIIADDFRAHVTGMPDADKDRWKQNVAMFYSAFSGLRGPIEEIVAEGDKVIVRTAFSGTHTGDFLSVPASGNHVRFDGYFTFRIADSKIVEEWGLMDMLGLMQQIGG